MLSSCPSILENQGQGPFQFALSCEATNLVQNSVGHDIDQRDSPPRTKPLCETALRRRTKLGGDHFDQRIQGLVRLPKSVDLPNRVKNGGVVATIVKSSDLGCAPSSHVPGQIHGNLPTQTSCCLIPRDASISEMIGDCGFNLL
jgi:hypothetical protein